MNNKMSFKEFLMIGIFTIIPLWYVYAQSSDLTIITPYNSDAICYSFSEGKEVNMELCDKAGL